MVRPRVLLPVRVLLAVSLASVSFPPLARAQVVGRWVDAGPNPLTSAGVLCTQLALAPDGTPYVSYQDEGTWNFRASVLRVKDGQWTWAGHQGDASVGRAWYNHLAFDAQGRLYLACRDYSMPGVAGVRVYDPQTDTWSALPDGLGPSDAHYTHILIDPAGVPYVALTDVNTVPQHRGFVRRLVNGAWESVGGGPATPGECGYTSLGLVGGEPWLAYMDVANGSRVSVVRFDSASGTWQNVGPVGFTSGVSANVRLTIAPDGTPWLAYLAYPDRVYVVRWDGASWVPVGTSASGADLATIQTENWRQWLSLVFDQHGRALVAYQDKAQGNRLTVRRYDGADWQVLGTPAFTPTQADYHALTVDPRGVPFVSYRSGPIGSPLGVMTFVEGAHNYCQGKVNSSGSVPHVDIAGAPYLHGYDGLQIVANRVPNRQPGLMIWGLGSASIPFFGGTLCVAPGFHRGPVQNSGGSATGHDDTGSFAFPFTHATMMAKGLLPGTEVYAQVWVRDPQQPDGTGVGLSEAIEFPIE